MSKNKEDVEIITSPVWPLVKDSKILEQDASGLDHGLISKNTTQDHQDMPIRVVVRKRPLSTDDNNRGEKDVLDIGTRGEVVVYESKLKVDLSKVYSYLPTFFIMNDC